MVTVNSSNHSVWVPADSEEAGLVSAALREILTSRHFRASRRYPAMLRYIVEKTLAHEDDSLKERTIGIEVFGRPPGYDTNADPVVRFSAGEIRKRLALFYQLSGTTSPIVLELPSGTYVPHFYHRAQVHAEHHETEHSSEIQHGVETHPGEFPANIPEAVPPSKRHWLLYLVVLALIGSFAGFFLRGRIQQQHNPVMEVWAPLLNNQNPVLICAGSPLPNAGNPSEVPDTSVGDHIRQPEPRVSMATLDAIADIAGYLKAINKPFRIHEASYNTLSDLYERPVVLVAGNDNKWTLLLLQKLRFHLVQVGQVSYIEDTKNPGFRGWSVDFSKPLLDQTVDYAIVGRFHSSVTGGPVIVAAGIGSAGTDIAGEFLVSPEALASLKKSDPSHKSGQNFEAVLRVEVVGGNPGAATVIASQFW